MGAAISRKDHRDYDAALEKIRREAKEAMAVSAPRERREKRDRAAAFILGLISIALAFLQIIWAAITCLLALLFFADWIANTERVARLHKLKIRALQAAAIVLGLAIGGIVFYPLWKAEQAAKFEGDLLGAGMVFVDDVKRGFPMVQIGKGTIFFMGPDGVSDIFPFFKDSGVKIETGKMGPLLTTTIRDRNGNLVGEVKQNHWKVYPQYCADKNYSKDALEVQDSAGHVVLQVRILPMTIQIQGEWWDTQGIGVRMLEREDPSTGSEVVRMNRQNQRSDALIKPMFLYPSKEHWSELAKR
jgi:hypothetical protein